MCRCARLLFEASSPDGEMCAHAPFVGGPIIVAGWPWLGADRSSINDPQVCNKDGAAVVRSFRSVGVRASLGSAVLFGSGTLVAKVLLDSVSPWLLAGLLYNGSGVGLGLHREQNAGRLRSLTVPPPSTSRRKDLVSG